MHHCDRLPSCQITHRQPTATSHTTHHSDRYHTRFKYQVPCTTATDYPLAKSHTDSQQQHYTPLTILIVTIHVSNAKCHAPLRPTTLLPNHTPTANSSITHHSPF